MNNTTTSTTSNFGHTQEQSNFGVVADKSWYIANEDNQSLVIDVIEMLSMSIHDNARGHGWWESERNDGEMIALIHSETSELLEGIRHGNPPSEHIPEFSAAEEESADIIIRILDMAKARKWRVGEAILAKMEYNAQRPYKHGGKKF